MEEVKLNIGTEEHLSDRELLDLASSMGLLVEELNEEWFSRFGMNYPYRLTSYGTILNCLSMQIVKDSECDKLILKQANDLRKLKRIEG